MWLVAGVWSWPRPLWFAWGGASLAAVGGRLVLVPRMERRRTDSVRQWRHLPFFSIFVCLSCYLKTRSSVWWYDVSPQHSKPQPLSSVSIFLSLASLQRKRPLPSRRIVSIFLPLASLQERGLLLLGGSSQSSFPSHLGLEILEDSS